MQDFTGVPAVVDLAAMRDAMRDLGGDPAQINPQLPAELVIDHSIQVDEFATPARDRPQRRARVRAQPRALRLPALGPAGLRRLQGRPAEHRHRPPGQPRVPRPRRRVARAGRRWAFPDTRRRHRLAHDDGERARRARLGRRRDRGRGRDARRGDLDARPAGRRLPPRRRAPRGRDRDRPRPDRDADPAPDRRRREVRRVLRPGARRPDARRPRDDREHVARVRRDVRLLPGRRADARLPAPHRPADERIELVEAYCKQNALWHAPDDHPTTRRSSSSTSSSVEPSLAGPRRPQDRVPLASAKECFLESLASFGVDYANGSYDQAVADTFPASDPTDRAGAGRRADERADASRSPSPRRARRARCEVEVDGEKFELDHGAVVIAAITSCTNTSNPQVMVGAGAAREERGRARPAPQAVGQVEPRARLQGRHRVLRARRPDALPRGARLPHRRLRLHDLHRELGPAPGGDLPGDHGRRPRRLRRALREPQLRGAHPPGGEGELPRLAAARRRLRARRPDGPRPARPSRSGRTKTAKTSTSPTSGRAPRGDRGSSPRRSRGEMFRSTYADVFTGDEPLARARGARGRPLRVGPRLDLRPAAAVLRRHVDGAGDRRGRARRALPRPGRRLGHDRPHLPGRRDPAARARQASTSIEHGVERKDFNSYGSRRGNHEVMVRGTFANVRLKNLLVPGSEGTWTVHLPSGEEGTIFESRTATPRRACRSS